MAESWTAESLKISALLRLWFSVLNVVEGGLETACPRHGGMDAATPPVVQAG
jgi:hypothetical protein